MRSANSSTKPGAWPTRRLLELVELPQGQVDPRTHPYCNWPLIAPDHVEPETGRLLEVHTAENQGAISGKYVARPSDVVLSKIRPALRKVVRLEMDALCSADMYPLRPGPEINSGFLFRLLLGKDFALFAERRSGRSGIPKINRAELREYQFSLPPLCEQRWIAEVLDAADKQISRTEDIIAKRQAVESALSSLECDASTDWMPLGELADVESGFTLGSEPSGSSSVEVPYLRVANVQNSYIDTTEMKKIRILRSQVARYMVEPEDVLLTEGGDFDKLGRGAVWDGRIYPCLHQNHIFRIRCRPDLIFPEYLALYTASRMGRRYFLSVAKQTTNLASINSTQLKAMPIPLLRLSDQERILRPVRAVRAEINQGQAMLRKLRMVKEGLADDLLTGRVRVDMSS
jgi:type I restriction enzyme, S subunit